jgi:hypothetical protein
MPKLFMFYLGGEAPGANIEVHDVQFAVAETPEEEFPELVKRWWSVPSSIHVDSYAQVNWADGYDVTVADTRAEQQQRLYFINMGGMMPGAMQESHEFGLFVAATPAEAKKRALKTMMHGVPHQHRDNFYDVDDCVVLDEVQSHHIHLTVNPGGGPLEPGYQGFLPLARG